MSDDKPVAVILPKSNTVKNMANAIRDTAKLELLQPVRGRVQKRMKELEEQSQATSVAVPFGDTVQWYTEAPKMFINKLSGQVQNGVGTITYNVYEMDENGNKKYYAQTMDHPTKLGRQVEYSGEYKIEKTVLETFEYGKPMSSKEVRNE